MKLYRLGRSIVLTCALLQLITTIMLFTSLQLFILLPANIFEHMLAIVFFAGIGLLLWGLVVKKEYQQYRFQFWDVLLLAAICILTLDNIYILLTPHPLFHNDYFI